MSILFASGGIVSSVATGGISLVAVSTGALLIQGWMKQKYKPQNTSVYLCISKLSTSCDTNKRYDKKW